MARHSLSDPARRDWCQWSRCKKAADLIYFGAGVCGRHFEHICEVQDTEPKASAIVLITVGLGLEPEDLTKKPS